MPFSWGYASQVILHRTFSLEENSVRDISGKSAGNRFPRDSTCYINIVESDVVAIDTDEGAGVIDAPEVKT